MRRCDITKVLIIVQRTNYLLPILLSESETQKIILPE